MITVAIVFAIASILAVILWPSPGAPFKLLGISLLALAMRFLP